MVKENNKIPYAGKIYEGLTGRLKMGNSNLKNS